MAKRYVFPQISLLLLLLATGIGYAKTPLHPVITPKECLACDLPAPSDFKVTAYSNDFIYLGWVPIAPNSNHTVTVFTRASQNAPWVPVETFPNVPGATFAAPNDNYDLGNVQFSIATNCSNGEPSIYASLAKPPHGYILELVVGGRTPTNLHQEQPCQPFKINPESWFGFEIRYNKGLNPPHNLFDVTYDGQHVVVSRVIDNNVVAGLPTSHFYPLFPSGSVKVFSDDFLTFKDNALSYTDIGMVTATHLSNGTEHFIDICKTDPTIWNQDYDLVVYSGVIPIQGSGLESSNFTDREKSNQNQLVDLTISNPARQNIELHFPQQKQDYHPVTIKLWDTMGNLLQRRDLQDPTEIVSLPANDLTPGHYFVQVISTNFLHCYNVLKL